MRVDKLSMMVDLSREVRVILVGRLEDNLQVKVLNRKAAERRAE